MIGAVDILIEFDEASRVGREHEIPRSMYVRSKGRVAKLKKPRRGCVRCVRVKCRCAKKPSSKHRRDYKTNPRRRAAV